MPQTKIGSVVSNKMQKTVVVEVIARIKHPLYKKLIKRTARFKARDEIGTQIGQKVKIVETKPFSKEVHFKVVETIK